MAAILAQGDRDAPGTGARRARDIWPFVWQISRGQRGNTASMAVLAHAAAFPPSPHVPPLWRESRFGLELAELRRSPVFRGHGVPGGDGRAVMLIPGFLAGDGSLATMTHWLRAAGYHTRRPGSAPTSAARRRPARGWRRGWRASPSTRARRSRSSARAAAACSPARSPSRRPDLVEGSSRSAPRRSPSCASTRSCSRRSALVSALGTRPRPRVFSLALPARRRAATSFRDAHHRPVPRRRRLRRDVLALATASSTGTPAWTRRPQHVEVGASHCGMAVSAGSTARSASRSAPSRARDSEGWAQAA